MGKIIWTIVGVLALAMIGLSAVFLMTKDEAVVRKAQDVETVLESTKVGELRVSSEEGKEEYGINPELALELLEEEIANSYSGVGELKLDYVFFDKNNKEYTLEEAKNNVVVGYQFKVTILDSKGNAVSETSERRYLDKKTK